MSATESHTPMLQSVRGLVLSVNGHGEPVERTSLRMWLRLSAEKFKAQKVDLYLPRAHADEVLPLLNEATHLGIRLSLYCTDATSPDTIGPLAEAGLLDVVLEPRRIDVETLAPWFETTTAAGLPLRLFVDGRNIPGTLDDGLLALLAQSPSVSIRLHSALDGAGGGPVTEDTLDRVVALATALQSRMTELHCIGIPFCWVPESLWPTIAQGPQQLAHHQHYRLSALEFSRKVYTLSPARIHQAVELTLGAGTSFHNRIDDAVLPWILERPWYFFWLWFLHKLTRRLLPRRPKVSALPEELSELEGALSRYRSEKRATLGPICAQCALHPICDHHTEQCKQLFPHLGVVPVEGAICYEPRRFMAPSTMWYDAIDAERAARHLRDESLYQDARRRIASTPPTREIPAESYAIEDHVTHRMPASVRWFSFSTAELQSTVLARLTPPFTLSLTLGGGIAQHMGFAFGRHTRLLCPMTAYDHKLTLHVDAAGHYVMLRDGERVIPATFEDRDQVPERLGTVVEPRITLVNIDGQIVTQTVMLWEDNQTVHDEIPCAHSVVLVCSKYARRLQAALMALAHQKDIKLASLEVLVGYVPGIDATDDVLDSLAIRYPELRIVRVPFSGGHARAKGFIINECLDLARGAWITLLDADIMLPPDYFAHVARQPDEATFVVPDGRHMLTPEMTSAVLLGMERPWENYDSLIAATDEYRHRESDGVPPGFCQSVRREVFEKVRYRELDHFEGSDWWFSASVINAYGKESRLEGISVLHLDHGGSQWYGTSKQF